MTARAETTEQRSAAYRGLVGRNRAVSVLRLVVPALGLLAFGYFAIHIFLASFVGQFNIGADNVGENLYEVSLKIDISSKSDEGTMFVVDLKYAGLFGVRNVPDDQLQPFFLAEAPRILFPFARRVVADVVRDGGFPPLLLEPIDFHGLFLQQAQAQADAGEMTPVGQA